MPAQKNRHCRLRLSLSSNSDGDSVGAARKGRNNMSHGKPAHPPVEQRGASSAAQQESNEAQETTDTRIIVQDDTVLHHFFGSLYVWEDVALSQVHTVAPQPQPHAIEPGVTPQVTRYM